MAQRQELLRCDTEIANIPNHPDVLAGKVPAWLVVLGVEDWKAEKRLITQGKFK